MKIPKTKQGKAGDLIARDIAKRYVDRYEEASREPDGKLWVEYEEDGETKLVVYIDSSDPEPLLKILKLFSTTGYFEDELQDKVRFITQVVMYDDYVTLMNSKTKTYDGAISALAENYNLSTKTAERRITAYRKILHSSIQDSI